MSSTFPFFANFRQLDENEYMSLKKEWNINKLNSETDSKHKTEKKLIESSVFEHILTCSFMVLTAFSVRIAIRLGFNKFL